MHTKAYTCMLRTWYAIAVFCTSQKAWVHVCYLLPGFAHFFGFERISCQAFANCLSKAPWPFVLENCAQRCSLLFLLYEYSRFVRFRAACASISTWTHLYSNLSHLETFITRCISRMSLLDEERSWNPINMHVNDEKEMESTYEGHVYVMSLAARAGISGCDLSWLKKKCRLTVHCIVSKNNALSHRIRFFTRNRNRTKSENKRGGNAGVPVGSIISFILIFFR